MAITVEDGTGLPNADSYISVTDADAYFTSIGTPATWTGAVLATKEEALRLATRWLDSVYSERWKGVIRKETQALHWPREGVWDDQSRKVSNNAVPTILAHATAEAAHKQIVNASTGGLFKDETTTSAVKREMKKVGPLETETEYVGGSKSKVKYTAVISLLKPLLKPRLIGGRLVRI